MNDRHPHRDGVLSLTRWYFEPPDQMLRLVRGARGVRRRGVTDPGDHLMLVRGAPQLPAHGRRCFRDKRAASPRPNERSKVRLCHQFLGLFPGHPTGE